MIIKMSAFETLRKVNRYMKSSVKIYEVLGETLCGLQSSPEYGMAYCDPCSTWSLSRIFKFKMINSHSCKESLYLLINAFIQMFSLIFLKISWRAAALHPLWMSCPW
jgi:hypothetical protein